MSISIALYNAACTLSDLDTENVGSPTSLSGALYLSEGSKWTPTTESALAYLGRLGADPLSFLPYAGYGSTLRAQKMFDDLIFASILSEESYGT